MPTAKQQPGGLYQVTGADGVVVGTGTRDYALAKGANLDYELNKNRQWQESAKPSEPAVISSESVDEEIAAAKARLGEMGKKGTTSDTEGNMYYADKSLVQPQEDPQDYSVEKFYGGDDGSPSEDYLAIQKLFDPLRASLDASTLQTVNVIKSNADALHAASMEANRTAMSSMSKSLFLAGGRYAPLTTAGRTLAEANTGLRMLQLDDDRENAALAAANAAHEKGEMDIMVKQLDMAEGIREKKQTRAQAIADKMAAANQKLIEAEHQASRDSAVADLVVQGITDPAKLLDLLNKDEEGNLIGDFSAEEIKKALGNLTVAGKASDLPADLKTFQYLNENGFLPEEIASLPPQDQYFAYLKTLKQSSSADGGAFTLGTNQRRFDADGNLIASGPAGKTTGGGGSDDYKLTGTQRSKLLAGDFTPSEIDDMERNLRENGLDAVLEGIDNDEQKALVRAVLSGKEADDSFKITKDSLRSAFGDDALREAADSWWQVGYGGATDEQVEDYLDQLMATVEQYRNSGLSDKEIMKKMTE